MKTYVLGLTGPTGSGKGTAAKILCKRGFFIIDADYVYHELLAKDGSCQKAVVLLFSDAMLSADGSVDTAKLRNHIGRDKIRMELLNNAVHPIIVEEIKQRIYDMSKKGTRRFVVDGPLLFESGGNRICDEVLCVLAEKETRIERIIARDNLEREQAEQRVFFQQEDVYYKKRSHFVVYNNADEAELERQILKLPLPFMERKDEA